MQKKILKEVKSHRLVYIILAASFFLRVYRIDKVLGFYFDQGRDALVIWDFLFGSHKPFLIGPTTGLAGIFRGPYYYYLIAPFYALGHGDPVFPSVFLSFTTVIAIIFIYYLGFKLQNRITGLIAAIVAGFSFNIVIASRWLSNPTPMLLLSMLLVWSMFEITQGTKQKIQKYWVLIAFVSGMSLFNFGSSGEFFYFPALFIFLVWQRKKWPDLKHLILSLIVFGMTFAPLVLFDLKHEHILLNNFTQTFGGSSDSGSFKLPTMDFIRTRNLSYWDIFTNKIFQSREKMELILLVISSISFLFFLPRFIKNEKIKVVLLLLISPIVGLYFYQGNYGVLYDYYMTGYYLIFILLFSLVIGHVWKVNWIGKVFVVYFFYLFFMNNLPVTWSRINDGCDGETSICFVNQKEAIDWIYKDVGDKKFNVDVYVPPVIPYAYDYLFKWYGGYVHGREPDTNQTKVLYTLFEVDPPHPERLDAWAQRQKGIGKVEETASFGGITVQRRVRLK